MRSRCWCAEVNAAAVDVSPLDWPFHVLSTFGYLMPRLLMMFSMIPMLTRQALPGMLRTGFVAGVAVFLVPTLLEQVATVERGVVEVIFVIVKESLVGMVLGLLMAVPLWAFEAMGALVDNQRGASIAQIINPMTGHDSSPLGELFSQAAMTYLLVSGGLLGMLGVAYSSYELWPVFDAWPKLNDKAPLLLLGELDRLTHLAVLMGAPVMIAMFLAEMGLGLVSRFAPQLQVFFLAMPVKSGIAMFVFAVYAVTMFHHGGADLLDARRALTVFGEMTVQKPTTEKPR